MGYISFPNDLHPEDAEMPIYAPKGACPGDLIRCSVTKVRRRHHDPDRRAVQAAGGIPQDAPTRTFAEAVFIELLGESDIRVQSPCRHFGHYRLRGGGCGGCTSMHVPYEIQLENKQAHVESLFAPTCDADHVAIQRVLPCENVLRYRNKMEFSYGRRWYETAKESALFCKDREDFEYALGLHAPQRYDKVVSIETCHIQPDVANDILAYIRKRAKDFLLEPYDTKLDTGYLRNVGIRSATNADGKEELMVNFITGPCDVPQRLVPFAQELMSKFPTVVCVVQNIRGVRSSVIVEDHLERLLSGKRTYIEQSLCGLSFRISANSFFQTNPEQANVLYEQVRHAARLTKDDTVLDLFCGTGTIALCLAPYAKRVYGIDNVPAAIRDAQQNAARNDIRNATFEMGNLEKLKNGAFKGFSESNIVIVDPPRAGLHPDLIKLLAGGMAKRIVYVSCNPVSQARDINKLKSRAPGKYKVTNIQPVDMFPNSYHVENVITIDRMDS